MHSRFRISPQERYKYMKNLCCRTAGVILASASILLVSGCAGQPQSTGNDVTITFLNPHVGGYDAVIAAFEVANPTIQVEQQSVPFDQMISQTQARLGSKDSSIDVVSVDPPRLPDMVEKGFLMDVSSRADEMDKKFTESGIKSVTWEGKQWAYPLWTSDNFLFYNKDVLTAAGIALPGATDADRMTWEQVLAAAQKVKESGAAEYGFTIEQVDRYYSLQPLLTSMGAGSGLTGDGNLVPEVNSSKWNEFGTWYQNLYDSGLSPKGVDPAQMIDLFKTGQSAFLLGGPTRIADLQASDLADKWGMAPHPYFEGKEIVTPTDSWAIGVSAYSENQDAARKFAEFATLDTDGSVAASSKLNLPPVNTEAFPKYVNFLKSVAPNQVIELPALFDIDTAQYAVHRPSSVGYVEFETTMNKAFADIRNGGDVTSILDKAQDVLERQLARRK